MFKLLMRKFSNSGIGSGEKGFTLIEVLVAVALMGILVVGIFVGLRTITLLYSDTNSHEIAKDIAASDMNYIMSQPYASNYTIFNPSSGPAGTVITIPTGSGWSPNDQIKSVTIGGTTSAYSLVVDSSGNLNGSITVPPLGGATGPQTIVITGQNTGPAIFSGAFAATNATTTTQYPTAYSNYTVVLVKPVSLELTEQQITINILFGGKTIYTLTDYRTNF
jgi:prepilin-type N-terminal cleavage/methylation domain-containing protein